MKWNTLVKTALIASVLFGSAAHADAASGMASGKRQHKPVTVIKPLDKASPLLGKSVNYRLCPDGTMIQPGEKCPEKISKR